MAACADAISASRSAPRDRTALRSCSPPANLSWARVVPDRPAPSPAPSLDALAAPQGNAHQSPIQSLADDAAELAGGRAGRQPLPLQSAPATCTQSDGSRRT